MVVVFLQIGVTTAAVPLGTLLSYLLHYRPCMGGGLDDALGDVRVARAAKPGLALVPEIEPTAEAWGDLVAGAVAPPAPSAAGWPSSACAGSSPSRRSRSGG